MLPATETLDALDPACPCIANIGRKQRDNAIPCVLRRDHSSERPCVRPFLRFGPDCSRAPLIQSMCAGIFVAGNRREAVKCQL